MFVATRYATNKRSSSNVAPFRNGWGFFLEILMDSGHFYFLNDQYFIDFPDQYLMQNKETINGQVHDRPCFYAFEDSSHPGLFWFVPFSSQTNKFQRIYNSKIAKYHRCDTIVFGNVLGHQKAFLIQNMCPVTAKYINNEYFDSVSNLPVRVVGTLESEIITKAKRVLALQRQGKRLIFPDVLAIESELLKTLP